MMSAVFMSKTYEKKINDNKESHCIFAGVKTSSIGIALKKNMKKKENRTMTIISVENTFTTIFFSSFFVCARVRVCVCARAWSN